MEHSTNKLDSLIHRGSLLCDNAISKINSLSNTKDKDEKPELFNKLNAIALQFKDFTTSKVVGCNAWEVRIALVTIESIASGCEEPSYLRSAVKRIERAKKALNSHIKKKEVAAPETSKLLINDSKNTMEHSINKFDRLNDHGSLLCDKAISKINSLSNTKDKNEKPELFNKLKAIAHQFKDFTTSKEVGCNAWDVRIALVTIESIASGCEDPSYLRSAVKRIKKAKEALNSHILKKEVEASETSKLHITDSKNTKVTVTIDQLCDKIILDSNQTIKLLKELRNLTDEDKKLELIEKLKKLNQKIISTLTTIKPKIESNDDFYTLESIIKTCKDSPNIFSYPITSSIIIQSIEAEITNLNEYKIQILKHRVNDFPDKKRSPLSTSSDTPSISSLKDKGKEVMVDFSSSFKSEADLKSGPHKTKTTTSTDMLPKNAFEKMQLNELKSEELEEIFRKEFNVDEPAYKKLSKEKFPKLHETRIDLSYFSSRHDYKPTAIFFYPVDPLVAKDNEYKKHFTLKKTRIFRLLKKAQTHNVVVKLVNSIDEINEVLSKNKDIDYVEFGFHGNHKGLTIGLRPKKIKIDKETIEKIDFSNLNQKATLLLSACMAGKGKENIACDISKLFDEVHVFAPEETISGANIKRARIGEREESESGRANPIYEVIIQKGKSDFTKHYVAGEIIEKINLDIEVNESNYETLSFMDTDLQKRFFEYLMIKNYHNSKNETITKFDWENHSKDNSKIFQYSSKIPISRRELVKIYLREFYDTQRIEYNLKLDL